MTDVVIKPGDWVYSLIANVFLDGLPQRGVVEINLTQGTLVRGYRGPPQKPHHVMNAHGYVFDTEEEDFVLETVEGLILRKWTDEAKARIWLARHGQ
jgi:hypothetical protein